MSALQEVFDAAKSEASRISREFSANVPPDPSKVFQYIREQLVEQATQTQLTEIHLRLIAQCIEEYIVDPECIDRLRLNEAKRIKSVNDLKKCLEEFFKASLDFQEFVGDSRQGELFDKPPHPGRSDESREAERGGGQVSRLFP